MATASPVAWIRVLIKSFMAAPDIYPLSLPTLFRSRMRSSAAGTTPAAVPRHPACTAAIAAVHAGWRSEEHTSEPQSLTNHVCRRLLEKKNNIRDAEAARLPAVIYPEYTDERSPITE